MKRGLLSPKERIGRALSIAKKKLLQEIKTKDERGLKEEKRLLNDRPGPEMAERDDEAICHCSFLGKLLTNAKYMCSVQ